MNAPLRVAIVHYHLKRGGVTRVVESTLNGFESLDSAPQCVVLAGEITDDFSFKDCARSIEGLHYSNAQATTPDSRFLLEQMRAAAREVLGGEPDVWHIHNHSLGKNSAMPGIVAELAESSEAVLLHMHDFAEDGRPDNFRLNQERLQRAPCLYPNTANVHYGVINARDFSLFSQTGLDEERIHLLANPVEAQETPDQQDSRPILNALGAKRLLLYPVRAVRRKNFGEMLLWAALADEGDVFASTLGPTNQNYTTSYEQWQTFALKYNLPVHFGIGESRDWSFEAIMHAADTILSTSIAEGFGLAFLEPWLFGKSIAGRDLPAITSDFKANGLTLSGLYESIPIPIDWIDLQALEDSLHSGLTAAYETYKRTQPANAVQRALDAIMPTADTVDFGGLNETLQQQVIERVIEDNEARKQLPRLEFKDSEHVIRSNAKIIQTEYNLRKYAANLALLYRSIQPENGETTPYIDPSEILDGFLKPERFRLLRT
ncbi:MAG: hypothetical protein AAF065_14535 [Verrucomicrobiota bacterium]